MHTPKKRKKRHFVYAKPTHPEFKKQAIYPYSKGILNKLWAPILVVVITLVGYFLSQLNTPDGQTLKGTVFSSSSTFTGTGLSTPDRLSGTSGTRSLLNLLTGWGNFILPYITVLAALSLIYGAILFLTAGGETDKVDKGKRIIIWSAIAIILTLSSFAIVNTLVNFDA